MSSPFSFNAPSAGSPFSSRQPAQASSSSQSLFSAKGPSSTRNLNGGTSDGEPVDDGGEGSVTYLDPVAYPRNGKAKWKESGRTIGVVASPVAGEIAAWITKKPGSNPNQPSVINPATLSTPDRTIYFASSHQFPDAVLEFYAETYTFFTSLQRIVAAAFKFEQSEPSGWDEKLRSAEINRLIGPPGAETIGHMARLVDLYLEEVAKIRRSEDVETSVRGRFDAVYHILHLAKILYLPRDGRGEGLLGEELLDWVNDVDPAPDNAQGNHIMQSNPPWENSGFWPYLSQCLLRGFHLPASTFLRSLSSHPHAPIAKLASLLSSHLSLLPRSHDTSAYPLDHQFLTAHQQWLMRFRAELATFTAGKRNGWFDDGSSGGGKWAGWENDFKVVIELMQGKPERVLEEASDWREALGAWGILVDVGLRRDDLPAIAERVLDRIPVDLTVLDDTIQSSLCTGDIVKVLTGCHELDIWLAAHLADVFDKLTMIPDEDRFDLSLRDYFLLDYTELLSGHPKHATTWSLVADYLHSAGEEGQRRLREYIVHIGIGPDSVPKPAEEDAQPNGDEAMDVEGGSIDPKFQHLANIREVCDSYNLTEEWKTISRVMADRLVREDHLGLAATMFVQADDTYGLSRLAEKILETYILQGEEEFLQSITSLPAILLNDAPATLSGEIKPKLEINGVFNEPVQPPPYTARLAFLAQFRDFILFRQQGAKDRAADRLVSLLGSDFAPVGFRAILLHESIEPLEDPELLILSDSTFELMRVLEDVKSNSSFAPLDYLGQLQSLLQRLEGNGESNGRQKGNVDLALGKLDEVRLALARNLARALVININEPF